jgi:hypothetical protein
MPQNSNDTSAHLKTKPFANPITAARGMDSQVLVHQLIKAYAEHQKYDVHLEKLHAEIEKKYQDAQRVMQQRIETLETALAQSRKEESMARHMFLQISDKEDELAQLARDLEEREKKVEEEEKKVEGEKEELRKERDEIAAMKASLESFVPAPQPEPLDQKKSRLEFPPLIMYHGSGSENLFKVTDKAKFEKYEMPVSFEDMNISHVELLRRHDYYKGWFDCNKVKNHQESIEKGLVPASEFQYLSDSKHAKNPFDAGVNAGALFTFAALCQQQMPEWNVRLDERHFTANALVVPKLHQKDPFWMGYFSGESEARAEFQKRMEEHGKMSEIS